MHGLWLFHEEIRSRFRGWGSDNHVIWWFAVFSVYLQVVEGDQEAGYSSNRYIMDEYIAPGIYDEFGRHTMLI